MPYQYMICVHFQTISHRCVGSIKNDTDIIEFSALMLNVKSSYVEAAFHEYVRPALRAKTDDCLDTEQTGLTRAFVERQKSFDIIYEGFEQWLNQIIIKFALIFATPQRIQSVNGVNVTFCTWTDWDLGHHFYCECMRNGIKRRDSMKSWIDVRRVFEQRYPGRFTFNDALNWAGIKRNYAKRSGIDDANYLAMLVMDLIGNGIRFDMVTSCSC